MSEQLIAELQKHVRFQGAQIRQLMHRNAEMGEEIKILRKVIGNQPIHVEYKRFNGSKYEQMYHIIDESARQYTKHKGSFWHWKELYEFIKARYLSIDWNPETIRRRCQLAVKEGTLKRVKPGTYIYFQGVQYAEG